MPCRPLSRFLAASAFLNIVYGHEAWEFLLTGACDSLRQLNGMTFRWHGRTLGGSPFWKAIGAEEYIYYDPDCDGNTDGTPRWIIDHGAPNVSAHADLDGDRKCHYFARINAPPDGNAHHPPAHGKWTMYCDSEWTTQYLILLEITSTTTTVTTTTKTVTEVENISTKFMFEGACTFKESLNHMVFELAGSLPDGSPFYRANTVELYLYHDAACDGEGPLAVPTWVLDFSHPIHSASACEHHASFDSCPGTFTRPPAVASWKMFCGELGWQDVPISLRDVSGDDPLPLGSALVVSSARALGPQTALLAFLLRLLAK